MANNAGFAFTFDLPENISNKNTRLERLPQYLFINKRSSKCAVKHPGATNVVSECAISNALQISFDDNSKGFNTEAVKKNGNSLLNYKKRIGI
jgi:hypothetical protein